jgi:hypothetical protein
MVISQTDSCFLSIKMLISRGCVLCINPCTRRMCSWGDGVLKRGRIQMDLDGIGAPASVPLSYSSALENKWSDVEPHDAIIMPPSSTAFSTASKFANLAPRALLHGD